MPVNVLFITTDQYRGDSLSYLGHPLVETPVLDGLCERGVCFANHWSVGAPCGPGRASLYTGTYLHHHRSVLNGTPLDTRFTNFALEARKAGYDPVLFGYTDVSVDPRTVPSDDPRLLSYEGILPGLRPIVNDPDDAGSLEWARWLSRRGRDVPSNVKKLYEPDTSFPGASGHAPSWAPAQFDRDETETAFMTSELIDWLGANADKPFFVHLSYIRPHPPYRNPAGYHDLYSADDVPRFAGHPSRAAERAFHPLTNGLLGLAQVASPDDEGERRQLRATYHGMQAEVDAQLGRLLGYLAASGLDAETLIVLTSDHGEMGGDHWAFEKLGYFDESFRVPLIVVDPRPTADSSRGLTVEAFTESVDVTPTLLDLVGCEIPLQVDGASLRPFVEGDGEPPEHWRTEAHFEWDFRNPSRQVAERVFGVPSAQCCHTVLRGRETKYVQFGTDPEVLPPILFDLQSDPDQLVNVWSDLEFAPQLQDALERLVRWRMRYDDATLVNHLVGPEGLVVHRDAWR